MATWSFQDGNIADLIDGRQYNARPDLRRKLHVHSSLIQRLALEKEMEGHKGCINTIRWNSKGSLLVSGSDDYKINIWSYNDHRLLHGFDSGHSGNIFCTKFIPETSDELVASGAADREVRIFNLSHLRRKRSHDAIQPVAAFMCHAKRVKELAFEPGNPNVVWSASEDGTMRQHDLRETTCCPAIGSSNRECRNILLDLRRGSKKSLANDPKQFLAIKSCDLSLSRPHQLLIGGSDAFARLYDRRMLPSLSSSYLKSKAPPVVNYFCPIHLSERKRSNLHLTHVTFSPKGEEVLLSYSGEHVYLMDVNCEKVSNINDNDSVLKYTAADVSRYYKYSPSAPEDAQYFSASIVPSIDTSKYGSQRLDKCKELTLEAGNILVDGTDVYYGIEACNEVLDGKGPEIDSLLRLECLCTRAALLLKRKWKNDVNMAIRDCKEARRIDDSSFMAHYYMSKSLLQLGKHKAAIDFAEAAGNSDPSSSEAAALASLKGRIGKAEAAKAKKNSEGTARAEVRRARLRSLNDIILRAEFTGPQESLDEREDSDYEEEMELDFETSVSGDEGGRDTESNSLRGSLNLRFLLGDGSNGDQGNGSSSNKRIVSVDMKRRYIGHCNIGTDIKQASFLGPQGEFVASGSDDGRWFIWEKNTGRLVKMLAGDKAVVNCIQCHPFDCTIATSGIDHTIKMWTPHAEVPSMVAGGAAGPETADASFAMEHNQRKLSHNHATVLPLEFFQRMRMHEFADRAFLPFECAQN